MELLEYTDVMGEPTGYVSTGGITFRITYAATRT